MDRDNQLCRLPVGPQTALRIVPCSLPRQKFLMRWAGPSPRGLLTPKRNSLSRLWPVQVSNQSPFTFSSPRNRNCRNPRPWGMVQFQHPNPNNQSSGGWSYPTLMGSYWGSIPAVRTRAKASLAGAYAVPITVAWNRPLKPAWPPTPGMRYYTCNKHLGAIALLGTFQSLPRESMPRCFGAITEAERLTTCSEKR